MNKVAKEYNLQGLRLVNLGRYLEAIDFFSKAIEEDPYFVDALRNRGETYILLDRYVEGNRDIQKAKKSHTGIQKTKKSPQKKVKMNMQEIDSIYDTVFPHETSDKDNTSLETEDNLYDYIFLDDTIEDENVWDEPVQSIPETDVFPACLEYLGGEHLEVAGVTLFTPTMDTISIIRKDGDTEQVVPLEQLECIRLSGVPEQLTGKQKQSCNIETIETVDGNIYHELVHPNQDLENLLFCFSTKEQTRFTFSLLPKSNIKRRCQQRMLGEILLKKRYITHNILKKALDEHQHIKSLKFGKIIAQKAHILNSAIERELEKAKQKQITGLKIGEILLSSGLVNEEQVLDALEYQESLQNLKIGQFLINKGIVQEKEIYVSLAEKHRLQFIDLRKLKISKKVLTCLPREMVLQHEIIPVAHDNGTLVVATQNVDTTNMCEPILKSTKCRQVQFALTQPTHIRNIISRLYKNNELEN